MRTTVEIKEDLRAHLLKLATERGEKDFSNIVEEALEEYMVFQRFIKDRQKGAVLLKGSLKGTEGAELRKAANKNRESWR